MRADPTQELATRCHGLSEAAGETVALAKALNRHTEFLDDPTAADDLLRILDACVSLQKIVAHPVQLVVVHAGEDADILRQARHDLRTPINIVKGYGEMLMEDAQDGVNSLLLPELRQLMGMSDRLLLDIDSIFRNDVVRAVSAAASRSDMAVPEERTLLPPGLAGRILAVDDTPANLTVLARRLERLGHSVATATSGKDALQLLQQESFDLVLLDLLMPEMSGYEVLSRIKSAPQSSHIPVVMISALNETASVVRCLEAGAEDYLPKPFDPALLRARVGSCLEKKRLRDNEQTHLRHVEMQAETLARELEVARQMQQSILPLRFPNCQTSLNDQACKMGECDHFPICPDIRLCANMIPAKEVAGDFFDFDWHDDRQLGFCVADVSGKGVPAALFMSQSLALFRALSPGSDGPADCLVRLNRRLCCNNEASMFVTLFYGLYDPLSGRLRYANAGHPTPMMMGTDGKLSCLPRVRGTALGIVEDCQFEEGEVLLPPGTMLCAYTDGITEAVNNRLDAFGEERLASVLLHKREQSVNELLESILGAVQDFAQGMPQADDITCLILRCDGRFSVSGAFVKWAEPKTDSGDIMRLVLSNQLPEIHRLADAINEFSKRHRLASTVSFQLNLVLDEILTNIISYGFAPGALSQIEVDLCLDDGKLVTRVLDSGKAFNPLDRPAPDVQSSLEDRKVGGLGIHFAKTLMDRIDYWRQGNKNCLLLVKQLESID